MPVTFLQIEDISCQMKTKYPIVLVHGLAMKGLPFLRAFGRIDRILRIQGYTVYVSQIDGVGSVETNARQLKDEIHRILIDNGTDKVNIIAHSKGGLDATYMIRSLEMSEHVASLTTLCTPHAGSPIASFILRFPSSLVRYAAFWVDLVYRIFGDKHPDSMTACRQLRRIKNENVSAPEGVFCQSFSSAVSAEEKHIDFVMGIPAMLSHIIEKNTLTDGLVPRDSAVFGKYRGDCIKGSVSHTEIIDFMVRDKYRDRVFAFYSALCEELAQMGY